MTFARQPVHLLELGLGACRLRYGAAPCTAGTEIVSGTSGSIVTAQTIELSGASSQDGAYVGKAITEAGGRGAICTAYDGSSKSASLDRRWPVNDVVYSDDFSLAPWTTLGGVVTAGAGPDPEGNETANLVRSTVNGGDQVRQELPGLSIGLTYMLAIDLKAGSATWSSLGLFSNGSGFMGYLDLDWQAGGTPTIRGTTMAQVALDYLRDGWWRVSGLMTALDPAGTAPLVYFMPDRNGIGADCYGWRFVLAQSTVKLPSLKTGGAAIGLPANVAYRVLETGGECYNSFPTCQDPDNYEQISRFYTFGGQGLVPPAGSGILPTITGRAVSPTELDIEKGLGRRGNVTVTLKDEAGPDNILDPYFSTRPPAAGTYWQRLLARNPNYGGRSAQLLQAYLPGAWDWGAFTRERYVLEEIAGPASGGVVRVTLKDPLKLTDRHKLPVPSEGQLAAALAADGLQLELRAGQGADYPAAGYVRVGSEVIRFADNQNDVLSWPDVSYRGTWGTTAAEASSGTAVQVCQVWQDAPATQVLRELLEGSQLESGQIDLAGFDKEELDWLGPLFHVTAIISAPEDTSKLLTELCQNLFGYMWYCPASGQVRFQVFAPASPNETVKPVSDAQQVLADSTQVARLDKLRTTFRVLYFALRSAVANRREAASYLRSRRVIDVTAESPQEYGDRRMVEFFSRWWADGNDVAARALVQRQGLYYRDAPAQVDLRVSIKDGDLIAGNQVDLAIGELVDQAGQIQQTRALITKRQDRADDLALSLRETGFRDRFGFIAPDTAGVYPADEPYLHITPDSGRFSDGTTYLIY